MTKLDWRVNLDGNEWQAMLPEIFFPAERDHTSKITCESAEVIGHFVMLKTGAISIYVPSHKVLSMLAFEGKPPIGFAA